MPPRNAGTRPRSPPPRAPKPPATRPPPRPVPTPALDLLHHHRHVSARRHPHRIAQRPPEAVPPHLHHIAISQPHAFSETERVRPEEMHVQVSRPAVRLELEMVMLH